ncbi:RIP metalloprotease RseP [Paenibacillus turicensis]|uniref:RIP metalloprotease RseP n=1 Tax=Paenibacillus turicensis TaxID=160487 RepID=UPI003D2B6BA6
METIKIVLMIVFMFFVIVTVHEWGHYYFAKRAGILVREFAIGFGPKLYSYRRNETQFTLRLLPFGGYARMAGEEPEMVEVSEGQTVALRVSEQGLVSKIYLDRLDSRKNVIRGEVQSVDLVDDLHIKLDVDGEIISYKVEPKAMIVTKGKDTQIAPRDRQYGSKTVGQRALAIFAGPLMNFLLAFVLFIVHIQLAGVPASGPTHLEIGQITEGMPAAQAGLKSGDIVESINGTAVGTDAEKMISAISGSAGKEMNWKIRRNNELLDIKITPTTVEGQKGGKVGSVIITFVPTRDATIGETFTKAGEQMLDMSKLIFTSLKQIVSSFAIDNFAGPVGTIEITAQVAKQGFERFIYWMALISLNLGIFNLLPFPALDGSRLVFLGVEAIRRKPIDPNHEGIVHFIGFAMLFLLMIAVTFNDIVRLITG